jgi:hypothetical protein
MASVDGLVSEAHHGHFAYGRAPVAQEGRRALQLKTPWSLQGARLGRSRWNIENGAFNLIINQGYCLEHNCVQDKTTLCHIIVYLMAIAFNIHFQLSVLQEPWAKAMALEKTTTAFFIELTSGMAFSRVYSTGELMNLIIKSRGKGS